MVRSAFSFLQLTDHHFILQFSDKHFSIDKLMAVIWIVSSKKLFSRNTLIFKEKGEKRPSLDAPEQRGFYLCGIGYAGTNGFISKFLNVIGPNIETVVHDFSKLNEFLKIFY